MFRCLPQAISKLIKKFDFPFKLNNNDDPILEGAGGIIERKSSSEDLACDAMGSVTQRARKQRIFVRNVWRRDIRFMENRIFITLNL
jgi:hypothetical protein